MTEFVWGREFKSQAGQMLHINANGLPSLQPWYYVAEMGNANLLHASALGKYNESFGFMA